MTRFLFPDNSVVVSFACADELDVLSAYLNGRGRVVEAVAREIADSSAMTPNLSKLHVREWFGTPIPISREKDIRRVEGIRVAVFGGTKAKPRQHLGRRRVQRITFLEITEHPRAHIRFPVSFRSSSSVST